MLQRIRGAIDRTIAEEQARQRNHLDASGSSTPSRSASTSSRRAARSKATSLTDAPNPDPAVFEAAFVIDDGDDASRAGTPKPLPPEKDEAAPDGAPLSNGAHDARRDAETARDGTADMAQDASELTPEIKQRLRKLEKLEATYPELLRSYRVAHRRATAIEPFEKALRENTPLTSITDPGALTEYLNQLNLRSDMVMEELKKVSADRDDLKTKYTESQDKLGRLESELGTLKSAATKSQDGDKTQDQQDFFSYDDEMPKLQAQLETKSAQIERLEATVDNLTKQLQASKQNATDTQDAKHDSSAESRAEQASLLQQLEARTKEINSQRETLEQTQKRFAKLEDETRAAKEASQLKAKQMEASIASSDKRAADLDAQLSKANAAKMISKKLIDDLNAQVDEMKKEKAEAEAAQPKQAQQADAATATQQPATPTAAAGSGGSKKKKTKKKAKSGVSASATVAVPEEASPPVQTQPATQLMKLEQEIKDKDSQIEGMSKQRKTEQELREEVESLQENLINIGQDHVEAKDKIKELQADKASLTSQVSVLQDKLGASVGKSQGDLEGLQKEYDQVQEKMASLQSEVGAAQQLAQSRFKDLTELREVLEKAQPELKKLGQESAELKTVKETLAAKTKELQEMDRKEKELEQQVARVQRGLADGEAEVKRLSQKLATESAGRQEAEEGRRVAERSLRRAEADKIELSAKAEKLERELSKTQEEGKQLRARIKELEEQMHKARRERAAAQEEAEFRSQQYSNAQGLLSSMRDQTAEMGMQLKEAQAQAEAAEEELSEVRRLLQERTGEGETMRRLLGDVDSRAEGQVREMRAQLEAAIEERDRIEEEGRLAVRRRVREGEELRQRIKELEGESSKAAREQQDVAWQQQQQQWEKQRQLVLEAEAKAEAEASEARTAVSQLRAALEASERQVQQQQVGERELRRALDEAQQRCDSVARELRAAQGKLTVSATAGRRGSAESSASGGGGGGGGGGGDAMYLKTILLQFLEQKDGKLRAQLVPVLGKLLKFDK
ncbi:hypothetical protein CDD82_7748 [Ophiocordyceps australis]|uniref:GRIP domain-containing protein n=1 Tax=Ophiocordyceps australis TaxID=1399860 RepID=A0A2C5XU71_9HYPO|nr:hypothetical protein CDD82_7748 [Ophiocordyceps australis]